MISAGHESALSLRTFTHGYDIYLPDEIQVWHLDYANYRGGRHKFWEAKDPRWNSERTDRMVRRIHNLFYGRGGPRELGRYGLGNERTVLQWAQAVGVDLGD